jgi:hypothetical protein
VRPLKSCVPETPNYDLTKTILKHCYACCTWVKKNVSVVMSSSSPNIIEKAKELFGENNVYDGSKYF